MHKRPFQALKLTFMHVSNLHQPYFDEKKQFNYKLVPNPNMVEEDLRHV